MFGGSSSEPMTVNITNNIASASAASGSNSNGTSSFLNIFLNYINGIQLVLSGIVGNVSLQLRNASNLNHKFIIFPSYDPGYLKYFTSLSFLSTQVDGDTRTDVNYDSRILAYGRNGSGDGTGTLQFDAATSNFSGSGNFKIGVSGDSILSYTNPTANTPVSLCIGTVVETPSPAIQSSTTPSIILTGKNVKLKSFNPFQFLGAADVVNKGGLTIDPYYTNYKYGTRITYVSDPATAAGDFVLGPASQILYNNFPSVAGLHMDGSGNLNLLCDANLSLNTESGTAYLKTPKLYCNTFYGQTPVNSVYPALLSYESAVLQIKAPVKFTQSVDFNSVTVTNFSIPTTNSNITTFSNGTDSTLTTNGTVIVTGGVGVGGGVTVGTVVKASTLSLSSTTTSTSTGTGSAVISGGVGIAENLNVGGNITLTGTLILNGYTKNNICQLKGSVDMPANGSVVINTSSLGNYGYLFNVFSDNYNNCFYHGYYWNYAGGQPRVHPTTFGAIDVYGVSAISITLTNITNVAYGKIYYSFTNVYS